jgi:hypothetical protein
MPALDRRKCSMSNGPQASGATEKKDLPTSGKTHVTIAPIR